MTSLADGCPQTFLSDVKASEVLIPMVPPPTALVLQFCCTRPSPSRGSPPSTRRGTIRQSGKVSSIAVALKLFL